MIIKSIHVRNFRVIMDETLFCDPLTVLVGPNGAGKSSFLGALDLFYESNAKYDEDDFFNRDTSNEISIAVTFTNLTNHENSLFQHYIDGEDLIVEKVLEYPCSKTNQRYHGMRLKNPDFEDYRKASGGNMKVEYNKLRDGNYQTFPEYSNRTNADETLQEWELRNPTNCERARDDGQFFGFTEVGNVRLERYTKFIFVPAVMDAADEAVEGKGNTLSKIMDLVVRKALTQRTDIQELRERTQRDYEVFLESGKENELSDLETQLNLIIKTYVPDAGVELDWPQTKLIEIPPPEAIARLVEDDYSSQVHSCGHGLQRAYILTMLHYLAIAQSQTDSSQDSPEGLTQKPNIVIAIEEPELYQHPSRQRRFAKILAHLSESGISGVTENMQIIYTTHSPLLVDVTKFDNIRLFCKSKIDDELPKVATIVSTDLSSVGTSLALARERSPESLDTVEMKHNLLTLMTPLMNEGFFADLIVLVEGDKDRGVILGVAQSTNEDLEAKGISVIPCRGKSNICKAAAVFRAFDIPCYLIWDSDRGSGSHNENKSILRLLGEPISDWSEVVTDDYACFEKDLITAFENEIGSELFRKLLEEACDKFGVDKKTSAFTNAHLVEFIVNKADEDNIRFTMMDDIIAKILQKVNLP